VNLPTRRETARHAVRTAFRVYRSHPLAIAGIAAVVFAPLALLDSFGSTQAESLFDSGGSNVWLGAMVLAGTSLLTAGSAVGAGLMDSFVVTEFGNDDRVPFGVALRRLPAGRLVVLDIAVSVVVAVGTVLGELPGLVAFTLLCLSGPLLVRGDLGVRAAMARSVDLTRRHLLVTVVVVTLPVVLEHEILDALDIFWDFSFLVLFGVHLVMAIVVLAPVVLCEIALAFTLLQQTEGFHVFPEPVSL
jgi:hypothetical protein